ncbi:hypothetical protein [Amycolatopsis echigonensis]|nr:MULTISPECIES: hypothetical protein [Amycolatopsis]MBB2498267.1 hypothetical protein [Amycolatopsis echigonensis]
MSETSENDTAGPADARSAAAELRGYAAEFDRAADEAATSRVRGKIRIVASGFENHDFEGATALASTMDSDCRAAMLQCS